MDKFVDVHGVRTRYREQGHGTATVLLHGASLGSSAEVWDSLLGPLASHGLRVLAPDLPGYGLTDLPSPLTPGYQQAHVLGFLDALRIGKANLVGHSMAGGLCVRLASAHAERVSRAVVIGTGSLLPPLAGVAVVPEGGADQGTSPPRSRRGPTWSQMYSMRAV